MVQNEGLMFEKTTTQKIFSETIRGMKLKLGIHATGISLYINCVFILVG